MLSNSFAQQVNHYIRAKAELFAPLTSHKTITGAGRENALREFVDDVPRRYEALTGTIAPEPRSDRGGSQVDLMVVNTLDYPVLVRDGGLAVVLPQSVEVLVEIKTDVDDATKLADALRQIRGVHRLFPRRPPLSILFSYGYPATAETLAGNLEAAIQACMKDDDGLDFRTDLPNHVIASGRSNACIAEIVPDSGEKVNVPVFQIDPVNTISYLLSQVLYQLAPKPLQGAFGGDGRPTDSRQREHAWSWVKGYFDIELKEPIEKTVNKPLAAPAELAEGDK